VSDLYKQYCKYTA